MVITQNVDNLHERAGSRCVIHLHGELTKARSTSDDSLIYEIGGAPIRWGDRCDKGGQLRPHVVWFGEEILRFEESLEHILSAGIVIVAGTSLTVYPAAGLIEHAPFNAEKYLVNLEVEAPPGGFEVLRGSADQVLPGLVAKLLRMK